MTGWHTRPFVSFDTETTGTDPETARIVSAAVVTVDPTRRTTDVREWLADPGIDIPADATAIHKITTEHAREHGRPAAKVVHEIACTLDDVWESGIPVVVYNAPYDLTLLDRELDRHDYAGLGPIGPVIDPLVIDKQFNRRYGKGLHQLGAACAIYGIDLSTQDAHGAAADALAAARLAWVLANRNPEIGAMSLTDLHAHQAGWYAEQADEFATYLRKVKARHEGQEAVMVPRDWPIRPFVGECAAVTS